MKQTKKFEPDESIFKDREKEALFWEKNFDKAWAAGKPIKIKFAKNLSKIAEGNLDTAIPGMVKEQTNIKTIKKIERKASHTAKI